MRKAILLLAVTPALQGCSYSYPVWATMVGGRLAFESGDRNYDCFTNIQVSAAGPIEADPAIASIEDPMERGAAIERVRTHWKTDAVATYECKADFPVVYGAPMPPGITLVPAKPLSVGVPYEVSVYGPKGAGGHGCFRINPDGRPENLPDQDCAYFEPPPQPSASPGPDAAPAAIVRPAEPRRDAASYIGPGDYPEVALRLGEEGQVGYALDIGADGRAANCTVTRSSGSRSLDAATCRIMRSRARFTPAMDDKGNPVPSRVDQAVAWTLPDDAPTGTRAAPSASAGGGIATASVPPPQAGGMMVSNSPAPATMSVPGSALPAQPINAMPPPDRTGPSQMYQLTPYRGIERYLRTYPSLAACERARAALRKEEADLRLCGFGPRRP